VRIEGGVSLEGLEGGWSLCEGGHLTRRDGIGEFWACVDGGDA
jgi:hypothetical protein